MQRLPKAIIKKYGITKKAWRIFRRKETGGKRRMAKKKKYGKRSSSSLGNLVPVVVALGYGYGRPTIANALSGVTAKVPLGNYSDNVVLGGIATLIPMVVKNKMVKDAAKVIQIYEAANAGSKIGSGYSGSYN